MCQKLQSLMLPPAKHMVANDPILSILNYNKLLTES